MFLEHNKQTLAYCRIGLLILKDQNTAEQAQENKETQQIFPGTQVSLTHVETQIPSGM